MYFVKKMDPNENESEEDVLIGTPPEITQAATSEIANFLPEESKSQYERAYKLFQEWREKTKQIH